MLQHVSKKLTNVCSSILSHHGLHNSSITILKTEVRGIITCRPAPYSGNYYHHVGQRWYSSDSADADTEHNVDTTGIRGREESPLYSFEELMNNIRRRIPSIQRTKESVCRVKRDVHSMMSISELVEFIKEYNAFDLSVIRIPPEKRYAEYLVICSGKNIRHIRKMAESLATEMRHVKITAEHFVKTDHSRVVVEGLDSDDWMAVDLGNIVVHFMLPEAREKYQIEKLWTLGEFDDMTIEIKEYNEVQEL